jgi:hypothetical protein
MQPHRNLYFHYPATSNISNPRYKIPAHSASHDAGSISPWNIVYPRHLARALTGRKKMRILIAEAVTRTGWHARKAKKRTHAPPGPRFPLLTLSLSLSPPPSLSPSLPISFTPLALCCWSCSSSCCDCCSPSLSLLWLFAAGRVLVVIVAVPSVHIHLVPPLLPQRHGRL